MSDKQLTDIADFLKTCYKDEEAELLYELAESSRSPAGSIAWSEERPTSPGWWWYEDEFYGVAPIYITWTGFIKCPEARELSVDMAVGEDQEMLGQPVADLNGRWFPMIEPPKQ